MQSAAGENEIREEELVTGREKIHSAGPSITDREIAYVTKAVTSGWYDDYRAWIERFESAFAEYLGVRHALATSSGTGALHLCLAASGIGAGDEVIVPDISWVATANVIKYLGATPVFVDVRLNDWNMDPERVAEALTARTRAIFPVHLYGHPCDMDAICSLAQDVGALVIEDACPAVGSTDNGRKVGTFGAASGFSFHGAKVLATGQGGMLVTDDTALYKRAVRLIEHGRDPSRGMFFSSEVGYHYKMPNISAALGLAQLERIDELVSRKRRLFDWYQSRLGGIDGIEFQTPANGTISNCSYPSIRIDRSRAERDEVATQLKAQGIDTRPAFPRMSMFPAFVPALTPNASIIEETGLNLPTAAYLSEDDVDRICTVILAAIGAS